MVVIIAIHTVDSVTVAVVSLLLLFRSSAKSSITQDECLLLHLIEVVRFHAH